MALVFDASLRRAPRLQVDAALAWLALGTVLLSSLALGGNRPVAWTLFAMIILGLFLVRIVLDVQRPLGLASRRLLGPALLWISVILWTLLQIWPGAFPGRADPAWLLVPEAAPRISSDPVAGAHHLLRLSAYGMVFWIILRAAEDSRRATAFLMSVAIFSTLLAGFGLITAWTGSNPILGERATKYVSASFVNRNSYATYALLGFVSNLGVYFHLSGEAREIDLSASKRLRNFLEGFFRGNWIYGLGMLVCLAALLFTESRAGFLSAVVAILAFAIAESRLRPRRNLSVPGIVLAIISCGSLFLFSGVGKRLMATRLNESRFEVYALVVEAIGQRPLTGYGIGSFEDAFRASVTPDLGAREWDLAHNSYLENAFEFGIPAALVFYGVLLWIAVVITRGVLTKRQNRVIACTAFASLVGAGFHALFDFSLQMPATAALFSAILALGWSQSFSSREAKIA